MTIYAVDRYCDRLITPAKQEYNAVMKEDKYHYFDTEKEAKDFIIKRALHTVDLSEKALILARNNYQKCLKKYGSKS